MCWVINPRLHDVMKTVEGRRALCYWTWTLCCFHKTLISFTSCQVTSPTEWKPKPRDEKKLCGLHLKTFWFIIFFGRIGSLWELILSLSQSKSSHYEGVIKTKWQKLTANFMFFILKEKLWWTLFTRTRRKKNGICISILLFQCSALNVYHLALQS